MSRELIDAIQAGDFVSANDSFKHAMSLKTADSLDAAKIGVADRTYNEDFDDEGDLDEEAEQIDEISRKTLASYVKGASSSVADHAHALGSKSAQADDVNRFTNRNGMAGGNQLHRDALKKALGVHHDDINKVARKMRSRLHGIGKASTRLAK